MRKIKSIRELKNVPAVYALFEGHGTYEYLAYVGVADKLRQRVEQHLIKHDSTASKGKLEIMELTKLKWWEDARFSDRAKLEAAELVFLRELPHGLSDMGDPRMDLEKLFFNSKFYDSIKELIKNPTGIMVILNTDEKIQTLEKRVRQLEKQLNQRC